MIEEGSLTKKVTHVLAMTPEALVGKFQKEPLSRFKGVSFFFFLNCLIFMYGRDFRSKSREFFFFFFSCSAFCVTSG